MLNESLIHRVHEVSSDLVTRNGSAYCGIQFLTQTHVQIYFFFLMFVISLSFVLSESKMTVSINFADAFQQVVCLFCAVLVQIYVKT